MKTLFNKYQQFFKFPLDDADINQILVYIEAGQIKRLNYEYGTLITLLCLEYCEEKEKYEQCAEIDHLLEINKLPKTIEEWKSKNISKRYA